MKSLLIVIALSVFAGAALLSVIGDDSGYVLIAYGNTSIEMSIWVFGMLLFAIVIFAWLIVKLAYTVRFWLRRKRLIKTQNMTIKGLQEYIEGKWKQSSKSLERSANKSESPLLNYILAARASGETGDVTRADELLKQAENIAPDAEVAIGLTRARLQFDNGHPEQCLATLRRVRDLSPENQQMLVLLREVFEQLADWESLLTIIDAMRRTRLLTREQAEMLAKDTHIKLMEAAVESASRAESSLEHLDSSWKKLPTVARKSRTLILIYARALMEYGDQKKAENILRDTLKRNWSDDLVEPYGLVIGEDVKKQLLAAQSWLKERPNNPALLLALGRLASRNRMWEEAQSYYESCLLQGDCPEAGLELGRLMLATGDINRAKSLLGENLIKTGSLPELPQPW